ncbi:DUF1349 domain-containing protein [Pantoea sp. R102]|nr:DUF1349 domain-containing protein [Pantoea sp. R102]
MNMIESIKSAGAAWINQPRISCLAEGRLQLTTEPHTDFWEQTYYGFRRHTGHAFGYSIDGDFTLQVKVQADFRHLYDQAGIFLKDDDQNWVKAGIEFNDSQPAMGCVVTRTLSDWSKGIFPGTPEIFWMRATLHNQSLRIQYSADGLTWPLLRLCHWPGTERRFVGVMACTPEREGLEVRFSEFSIRSPLGRALHDLT